MRKRRYQAPGTAPGTLTPPDGAHVPEFIQVIRYNEESFEEVEVPAEKLAHRKDEPGVTWVNVYGLGNLDIMQRVADVFGLHPLALEDVLSVPQRPKLDTYADHLFVVLSMLHLKPEIHSEQVSVFLGANFVVTFQEKPGDCLEPVRERLRKGTGQLRGKKADYLMYAILDAVIDQYFPFLESFGEHLEAIEEKVVDRPERATVSRVHGIKRDLLSIRRSIWPLREVTNVLIRDESPLIGKATHIYLRDCYDHTVQVVEIVETYREIASGLTDMYMSSLSNKMNEVMKVLTIMASIFIPLTFIAGVYGMNFERMPELKWSYGYPLTVAAMALVAALMILFFRRKGWIGGGKKDTPS